MKRKSVLFPSIYVLFLLSFITSCSRDIAKVCIIPTPNKLEQKSGYFSVDSVKALNLIDHDLATCDIDTSLENEEYIINVSSDKVTIKGGSSKGIFYGKQTLRQLICDKGIPCIHIQDKPRFSYRGFQLDVSRHFFPKEEILKLLDEMANYKLNTFHFHLTDNGGWRVQIDKYPELTRQGAFRTEADWVKWWEENDRKYLPEGTPDAYGGYYTKNDIREIVAYASDRNITVIPEIEFPAHSDEVFIGYPELTCTEKPYGAGEFCAGNEKVYTFIDDVLSEIIELFPSEMIHIGGDEARMKDWENCPKCKKLMQKESMKEIHELQSYIIKHAEKFLNAHGRRMIGWDEILKDNPQKSSVVMCYRGQSGALTAASKGYDAVLTTGAIIYFDWYQSDPSTEKNAMYGYSPIAKVYDFNPVPMDSATLYYNELLINEPVQYELELLNDKTAKHILGVQGTTFTEYMPSIDHLEYMIFPRFLAVAEIAWSKQENRSWNDFKIRVNQHITALKKRGINTFSLSDEVDIRAKLSIDKKSFIIDLDTEVYPAKIHYTVNGEDPSGESSYYTKPFETPIKTCIKAAVIYPDGKVGKISEINLDGKSEFIIPERWSWHK